MATQIAGLHPLVDFDVAMEVASHEAVIRQTYKDSVNKDTWSVGMTNATGHTVQRYIGKPASMQHCMNIYVWALQNYAAGVYRAFKGHKLTKAQFAAALSFHWNTGAIERASWVQIWKRGDIDGAKEAFMNWVTPPEIEGRRAKERDLFFDGKWSNDGRMTEYTRLTAKRTPVWSSAIKVDVSAKLRAAFAKPAKVELDVPMQPDAPVTVPTPDAAPKPIPAEPLPEPYTKPGGIRPAGVIITIIIAALAIAGAFFFRVF